MAAQDTPRGGDASGAVEHAKERAVTQADAMQGEAYRAADDWKAGLGDRAGHVAEAVRAAGDSLRGKEDLLADAADRLCHNLDKLSDTMKHQELSDTRRDLEEFARARPALFMGAAVAVGVGLGRLLRSAPPLERESRSGESGGSLSRQRSVASGGRMQAGPGVGTQSGEGGHHGPE